MPEFLHSENISTVDDFYKAFTSDPFKCGSLTFVFSKRNASAFAQVMIWKDKKSKSAFLKLPHFFAQEAI